jgi:hypothetical protein
MREAIKGKLNTSRGEQKVDGSKSAAARLDMINKKTNKRNTKSRDTNI